MAAQRQTEWLKDRASGGKGGVHKRPWRGKKNSPGIPLLVYEGVLRRHDGYVILKRRGVCDGGEGNKSTGGFAEKCEERVCTASSGAGASPWVSNLGH